MLENIKECEVSNSNTILINDYNISSTTIEEYTDTVEFRKIKELIYEDNLIYVTEYIRELLNIKKENEKNCFKYLKQKLGYNSDGKRVIIYVRLSVEDLEKTEGNVSKSILNQLLMLLTYCVKRELEVVGIFYEEDMSGADGDRVEWNKSLLFCELGNADIYICKTQARFARSIEFVDKYLHKKFIEWNIRFLSIVDNIDTNNKGSKKSSQITAMTDEWKVEEQSVNTKKTLRAKNDAGQWTGSFAPYGYIEDPKDMYHIVIDEPAAKVVREIYELYASGKGYQEICRTLNEKNIPTPSKYKKLQGSNYYCPSAPNGAQYWNTDTIRKILMDETYDGLLIQHRTERIAYNVKGFKKIPKNEQSIIACSHDKIVDTAISKIVRQKFKERKDKQKLDEARSESRILLEAIEKSLEDYKKIDKHKLEQVIVLTNKLKESLLTTDTNKIIENFNELREFSVTLNNGVFSKIQDNIQVLTTTNTRSRPSKNGEVHIFSQKVYCKCCGKVFQKNNFKSGPRKNPTKKEYLRCKTRKAIGSIACVNNNSIRYEVLEEIVLKEINNQIEKYYNQAKLEKSYYEKKVHINYQNDVDALIKEINILEKKVKENQEKFSMMYDDKAKGIITSEEFIILKNKNQSDTEKCNKRIKEINLEITDLQKKEQTELEEKVIFEKYKNFKKLDKLIIDTFISKILIGKIDPETKKREIRIIWNINV